MEENQAGNKDKQLKICWAHDFKGIGNAYGYTTHNKMMRDHTAKIADVSPDGDIAIHIQTADKFKPIEGKKNILFTMFEGEAIPNSYIKGINEADHLIVPCKQNKQLFQRYTDRDIYVCHEGVDLNVYTFKQREFPKNKPFRFLWVGAPNQRKGWEEVMTAWKFGGFDNSVSGYTPKGYRTGVELYLKTTIGDLNEQKKNVIFDSSNKTLKELVELYHSAHCFLFPTRGEGWGLTLSESMATGLPCIATKYSGTADFFDDYVGYSIPYELRQFYLEPYQLHTHFATPNVNDLMSLMVHVYNNYKEALRKGRKAADRIAHYFTWPKAAARLVEIVREVA